MKKKVVLCLFFSLMATSQAFAKDFLLGRTILQEGRNRNAIIPIPVCRRANEIQIQAERKVFLTKVIVNFQNGDSRTFQFQRELSGNERTAWRQFSYTRCIADIKVHGRASDASAGIKVFGRR